MRNLRLHLLHAVALVGPCVGWFCIAHLIGRSPLVGYVGRVLPLAEPVWGLPMDCLGHPGGTAAEKQLWYLHLVSESVMAQSAYLSVAFVVLLGVMRSGVRSAVRMRHTYRVAATSLLVSLLSFHAVMQLFVWVLGMRLE